ncbi:dihydrofolate reductase [Schleiferilactobacillus harbinensis]|jgi:dihydrofolate reductase|uniref:Dihydrofolate reductase n=1 Tax=Schleiferilactobacillus harbinensis TaxID=304207 RepID=A0A5P8M4K1_9LACO|nr:dihydrofolate reductase [Schleiferilactobacillus harbinensis]MBO3090819.1 dihydrofolate reductase [Schleiferilactobacillus harbinensis]QFR23420.1 dihydrofolate reductase [Schleiferilactobacillus harbinensis]
MLAFIWAEDRNHLIGTDDHLPWHLPDDLHYFKKITEGHTILMGRRTWDSLPTKPLPNRTSIVLTHRPITTPGVTTLGDVAAVQAYIQDHAAETIFIIGGRSLFAAFMNQVDRLYVTRINHEFPTGDTYMVPWDQNDFQEIKRTPGQVSEKAPWPHAFVVYARH